MAILAAILAGLLTTATQAIQPSAPEAIAAPLRDLPLGQLNFLHTTDTHGWHAGHLQELVSMAKPQRNMLIGIEPLMALTGVTTYHLLSVFERR